MKFIDLHGQTFGRLRVLGLSGVGKSGQYQWKCRCDCGTEVSVNGYSLRSGHTKSCGCRHRWLASINNSCKIKQGSAFRKVLRQYKSSARTRGIAWELTDEQFREIITKPCHYTGRLPSAMYVAASGESFTYSGIDRKDSNIGYVAENCISCCTAVNWAKSDMPYEAFLQLIGEIARCKKL